MVWRVRKPALALGAAVVLWRLVKPRAKEHVRTAGTEIELQDFPDTEPAVWTDSTGRGGHDEGPNRSAIEV